MNLPSFPDEILLQMTAYLNNADLQSFALTARDMRGPAQEALHQYPDLGPGLDCRLVQFVRTLSQRPSLAEHVRSLRVSGLLLRGTHILPPIDRLERIIDLLTPDLRNNDRVRSVLLERRSKAWLI